VKNAASTLALGVVLGCAGALATAQTAPPALVAELADYLDMPRTTSSDGRSMAARVNVLIEVRAPRHRDHPFHAIVITCCTAS